MKTIKTGNDARFSERFGGMFLRSFLFVTGHRRRPQIEDQMNSKQRIK